MTMTPRRELRPQAEATFAMTLSGCAWLLLVSAALAAGPAAAPTVNPAAKRLAAIDAEFKKCVDRNSSTAGLKDCAYEATSSADKVLNDIYKAAVASLRQKPADDGEAKDNTEKLARLLASEVAWIKYRDTDCELQGTNMLGGTGEGLVVAECQYTRTARRARDLDELFGPEGK